jgi:hypothetical protein
MLWHQPSVLLTAAAGVVPSDDWLGMLLLLHVVGNAWIQVQPGM